MITYTPQQWVIEEGKVKFSSVEYCNCCGSINIKTSKKGNRYCGDLCWKNAGYNNKYTGCCLDVDIGDLADTH